MGLSHRFNQECEKSGYCSRSSRLVLAVSGGVDSMVLLDLLLRLPAYLRPEILLAHVNHQLRKESDMEKETIQKVAEEKGIPFYSTIWPVEQHPASGIEEAARAFRYAFFEEIMNKTNASYLATAHHRSDQLETLLMRFVRGGQIERMTGIRRSRPFHKGHLVRPLLSFSKEEIYEYAESHDLLYFEDASNADLQYTRNRYRHVIIPLLKKENHSVEEHAEQFAQEVENLLQLAQPLITEAEEAVRIDKENELAMSRSAFLSLEAPMQNFVLSSLLQKAYKEIKGAFKRIHVRQIIQWLKEGKPNSELKLPDQLSVVRVYDVVRFVKKERKKSSPKQAYEKTLSLGEWAEPANHSRIGLFSSEDIREDLLAEKQSRIYLNPKHIKLPLIVRTRRPGDRMTLKGMERGTKKVKDIFIDQKVPVKDRDEAVVVTDADGDILWVVNFKESSLSIKPETDTIQYILICEHV